jgi:hypothetical protein
MFHSEHTFQFSNKHFTHHITKILTVQENKDLYEEHSNLICQWNISLKCQHSVAALGQLGKTIRKGTSRAWGSIPNGVIGIF